MLCNHDETAANPSSARRNSCHRGSEFFSACRRHANRPRRPRRGIGRACFHGFFWRLRCPGTRSASPSPVLQGFDPPEQDWLPGHRGVDLDIAIGAPIAAAGSGTVHFAGTVAGTPTISINHDGGLRTTYQPVFARVSAGDHVVAGEIIGTLAPPINGEPGLHWGARTGPKTYINPLDLLGEVIIRLKPWD